MAVVLPHFQLTHAIGLSPVARQQRDVVKAQGGQNPLEGTVEATRRK